MLGKKAREARRLEEEAKAAASGTTVVKGANSPAMIRLKKEFTEIELPGHAKIHLDNPDDLMNSKVTIDLTREECRWMGGKYTFRIECPFEYPHKAPKCTCETQIYHPNIDTKGAVCLNILRADWKPVLGINQVILGLIFLFIEPNPNDPLNHDAAKVLRENPGQFDRNVSTSLRGGNVDGISYPKFK